MDSLHCFREIWLIDFEFSQAAGERPSPVCLVAREFRTGRLIRSWSDQLDHMAEPPFSITSENLIVAYFASAEMGCFLALGWPVPPRVLDLYAEFRCRTSGLTTPCGAGLLGAMAYYGLGGIEAAEKDSMRQLAMRGGPYTAIERESLLDYCQTDVDALARLLPAMLPDLDVPRALLRGRYMSAVARMEWAGVPVDVETLELLKSKWASIQDRLIERIDRSYGVYEGRSFKMDRWASWLSANDIPWPCLPSGSLALDDDTFRDMARSYPEVAPVRELRTSLAQLRLNELAVGVDGRSRCLLSPFGSRTGRNQPSNARFIFGPSAWLRSLIRPERGRAVAYLDYEQQEFGIAAALSGDPAMQHAYRTGDPYLEFAKQAGAVPSHATKLTHKAERERYKTCALAVQYGMGPEGLGLKLGESPARGRELIGLHHRTYPMYWRWSDSIRDYAVLNGSLHAVFGWKVHVGKDANPRSLRNFPLQANGAEMLRLACSLMTEQGFSVCCPVHDAVLIEAAEVEIDDSIAACQAIMQTASEVVLSGFPLRTEANIIKHPDRYMDKRGETMWNTVMELAREAS